LAAECFDSTSMTLASPFLLPDGHAASQHMLELADVLLRGYGAVVSNDGKMELGLAQVLRFDALD
jgi:hypothetical protein